MKYPHLPSWVSNLLAIWPENEQIVIAEDASRSATMSLDRDRENKHIALIYSENVPEDMFASLKEAFNDNGWSFTDDREITKETHQLFLLDIIEEIPDGLLWGDGRSHVYRIDKTDQTFKLESGEKDDHYQYTAMLLESMGWKMIE